MTSLKTPKLAWFEQISALRKLEEVLVRVLPRSVQLLNICRIACENGFPEDVNVQFYRYTRTVSCEENEWWKEENDNSQFIVCIQRSNFHAKKGVILLTPENVTPEMAASFDSFIDWSESQVFQCIQPPFWSFLQDMCTSHANLKPENSLGIPGMMLAILDGDQKKAGTAADKSESGDDGHDNLYIRLLEDKDVAEVEARWKWRAPHSEQVIRNCIKIFLSCGLFLKKGKDGGNQEELVSSVLFSPLSIFNILFTPEKHRRKGYGKIVMRWVAQQLTKRHEGIAPMAEVESWNMASKGLLESVGFVEIYATKWYFYDPTLPTTINS